MYYLTFDSSPADNPFVDQPDVLPEIYASGLRNPWRFDVDMVTGDVLISDVGSGRFEEVNLIPADSGGGQNFGWQFYEGTFQFRSNDMGDLTEEDFTFPIFAYTHDAESEGAVDMIGCAIIGGKVYRGADIPELIGRYLFGDFCTGQVWSIDYQGDDVDLRLDIEARMAITAFGQDSAGEIYIAGTTGKIYKIVPAMDE